MTNGTEQQQRTDEHLEVTARPSDSAIRSRLQRYTASSAAERKPGAG
jgi:hypothetical protein